MLLVFDKYSEISQIENVKKNLEVLKMYEINVWVKKKILKESIKFLKRLQHSLEKEEDISDTGIQIAIMGDMSYSLSLKARLINYEEGEIVADVTISRDVEIDTDRIIDERFVCHIVDLKDADIEFSTSLDDGFDDIVIVVSEASSSGDMFKCLLKYRAVELSLGY